MGAETITLQLTAEEANNLIAFGNRATMTGAEADTWVDLKKKVALQVETQKDARRRAQMIAASHDS